MFCVFKRGNADDLYRKLVSILNSNLEERAICNFEKSKEFIFDKLQKRRQSLYNEYRESVLGRK